MTPAVNDPSANRPLTMAEQDALNTASTRREQCVCGETHDDNDTVTPATIARMKIYLAGHPGQKFVVDEDTGLIAVIISPALDASGPLQVLAQSGDLLELLNDIGAPTARSLSLPERVRPLLSSDLAIGALLPWRSRAVVVTRCRHKDRLPVPTVFIIWALRHDTTPQGKQEMWGDCAMPALFEIDCRMPSQLFNHVIRLKPEQ